MEHEKNEMLEVHRYQRVKVMKDGRRQTASAHETVYIPKSRLGDLNMGQEVHFKPEDGILAKAYEDKRYTFVGTVWVNGYIVARYVTLGVVVIE